VLARIKYPVFLFIEAMKRMALELADLIPDYPTLEDPLFAGKLIAKREFSELKLSRDQEPVGPGELFRSQLFVKRILAEHSTVDAQLVIHDVGTGKTCAAAAVAEAVKNKLIGPGRKRALIVVKGDTVEQSFKDNLIHICTTGEYLPATDRELTVSGQRNLVTKNVNVYYEIVHYIELAKTIDKLTPEEIKREYSDRVMIFDESHNLRMGYFAPSRKKGALSEEEREMANLKVYDRIWDMLHFAKRKKVLLLSATPVVDRPEEFGLQMNLLLPENLQIPSDYDWENPTVESLEEYLRGMITFVRSSTDVPIVRDQGVLVELENPLGGDKLKIKLVLSEMSEDQDLQYQRYSGGNVNPNEESDLTEAVESSEEKAASAFRRNERYASMFIFPRTLAEDIQVQDILDDESLTDPERDRLIRQIDLKRDAVGTTAFNSRIKVDKTGDFSIIPDADGGPGYLADSLMDPEPNEQDRLRILSAKVHTIIEEVRANPKELAFIYTEFVKGPGAILIGLSFENRGFARYNNEQLYGSQVQHGSSSSSGSGRPIKMSKKKRYAVISGSSKPAYIKNTLEVFRSPENRYGDYIQVLIGSNVTREGISFKNVRQVHVAHPFWNDVPVYQAIGRAFRERAQADLLPEERYVKVYKHAAIRPGGSLDTVDIQMYSWAEGKRYRISRVLRIAKRIATDCALNKARNQQRGEEDYSRGCDYDKCAYTCVGSDVDANEEVVESFPADDSTYFLYYSNEVMTQIKSQIKALFKTEVSLSLEQIIAATKHDDKYILRALNEIIRHNEAVYAEFGQVAFLKEVGNSYFLQFDITGPEEALGKYTHALTVSNHKPLAEFIAPLQEEEDNHVIAELEAMDVADPLLDENIIATREEIKAKLLERSLLARVQGVETPLHRHVTDLLLNRWYVIDQDPFTSAETEIVFHDILTRMIDRSLYGSTTKSKDNAGRIRILDGDQWRFVTSEESTVYYDQIQEIDDRRRMDRFANEPVYGTISTIDGIFRIERAVDTTDRRKIKRGRICTHLLVKDLIGILDSIGLQPPVSSSQRRNHPTRNQMVDSLSKNAYKTTNFEEISDEDVLFMYQWALSDRNFMCAEIRRYLEDHNLLIIK
jgi:hypothetical protein